MTTRIHRNVIRIGRCTGVVKWRVRHEKQKKGDKFHLSAQYKRYFERLLFGKQAEPTVRDLFFQKHIKHINIGRLFFYIVKEYVFVYVIHDLKNHELSQVVNKNPGFNEEDS